VHIAPGAVGSNQIAPGAVAGAQVADGGLTIADLADPPRVASASGPPTISLSSPPAIAVTVTITAPAAGQIIANASGYFTLADVSEIEAGRCEITTGTTFELPPHLILVEESSVASMRRVPFGGTRVFTVTGAGPVTINLVCEETSGDVIVANSSLTLTFVAGS
jgi:hypothetical protein